jgi:hypothetical protein
MGSTPLGAALAISLLFLSTPCALSQGQHLQQINAAVKTCVEVVNAGDDLLPHLEAYFDPAAGKVYYNVAPNFQWRAIAFEKCMAERGFPLH